MKGGEEERGGGREEEHWREKRELRERKKEVQHKKTERNKGRRGGQRDKRERRTLQATEVRSEAKEASARYQIIILLFTVSLTHPQTQNKTPCSDLLPGCLRHCRLQLS